MELGSLMPAALLLLLLFLLYKYGTRTHGTLERLGIPVVPPLPFLGSTPQPWTTSTAVEDLKNALRFGKVWGDYEGTTPQIFVNDGELAKRIFIKDFDHFVDRPNVFDFEIGRDMLDVLHGDRWKTVRSELSPTLMSAAKLKAMMPVLTQSTEDACRRLDEKLTKNSDVSLHHDLYGSLVLDAMSQFSFGVKFDDIGDPESKFVKLVSVISGNPQMIESKIAGLMTFFPMLSSYILAKVVTPVFKYCLSVVRSSIKQRRAEGVERADIVGALIDAIDNKVPTKQFQDLNITEDLLMIQGAAILMASYDTTGSTLSNVSYYLATHPDVMERVVEEVRGLGDDLTYESLQRMPLLDAALQESQRIRPVAHRHIRLCVKDWEADGVRIPAGTQVVIPLAPYHMNPEVFPEPEHFNPDRWLGEKGLNMAKDYFMPFGVGPRACLGMRLALVMSKFVLAYVLKRYKIWPSEKTKIIPCKGINFLAINHPIVVKMVKL